MESNARPEAPDMPAGAAPAANEVPLQPLPFMSKPQLPAETAASLEGRRNLRCLGTCTRLTGVAERHDPGHSFRCATAKCAAVGLDACGAGDPLASAVAGTASRPAHNSIAAATAGIRGLIDPTAFHPIGPRPLPEAGPAPCFALGI